MSLDAGFTLLARGFFQDETADSLPNVRESWLRSHPDAIVVPVVDFGAAPDGSQLYWVWVVDGRPCQPAGFRVGAACGAHLLAALAFAED